MQHSTFRGGVHPEGRKELSSDKTFQYYLPKGDLVYPLSQHIGKPAIPIVKKNDPVLAGQIIAKADGFISANIISSCSGKVKSIEPGKTASGVMAQCIVIENDGKFTLAEGIGVESGYTKLSAGDIVNKVQAAGIVGLGGAGFPTHVKLSPKNPDEINYIIANGAECEPYITCDDQLMRTHPEWVVEGIKVLLHIFPAARGVVAIEDNKPEAIAAMEKAIAGEDRISVLILETKFPQGGERNLVHAVTGRRMASKDLPANLGCIVDNVATLASIYRAVCFNEPLMEKGVTITGEAVNSPGNFIVKIGSNIKELLNACGGFKTEPKKVLLGGPMMGNAIADLDIPLQKTCNAITCFDDDPVELAVRQMTPCIRCGRCVQVCPVGLVPQQMQVAAECENYKRYERLSGMDCIACGSCSYICPAKRPLTQLFTETKSAILAQRRKEAAK